MIMKWTLITNTEYDNNNQKRIEFQGLTELKAFTTYTTFQQKVTGHEKRVYRNYDPTSFHNHTIYKITYLKGKFRVKRRGLIRGSSFHGPKRDFLGTESKRNTCKA